jgi:hypothetical protein
MDRRLILAVAGSGKTRFLINHLNLEKDSLLLLILQITIGILKAVS